MKQLIKNHKIFLLILLLFLVIKAYSILVVHDLWWDSAVYAGMGKYLYSSGESGLWEASRPLVWPLILGFFWKISLDYILFGKLIMVLFSSGILALTYLIGCRIFNRKTAVIAALFLSLSQTFFLFGNVLHSEIPSAFFVLLGFYFFINKKYNFSGLFLGIAFMTRFFQIFAFIALVLLLFYLFVKKKEPYKSLFYFSLFFLIPIIPYLVLNYILYNNILYPFLLQSWMSQHTGWIFSQPIYFYLINLIKENILVLFSVSAIIFLLKNPKFEKTSIVLVFLFLFVPYNFAEHKEMRLIIAALPFLFILTSYGLIYFAGSFRKIKSVILFFLLVAFVLPSLYSLKFDKYNDNLDMFYSYIENEEMSDGLWISNPAFIAYSNDKADNLIYYPLYNSEKIDVLIDNIGNAKHVLINTCDILPCPPSDVSCSRKHNHLIGLLKERFGLLYYEVFGSCEYYIFGKN